MDQDPAFDRTVWSWETYVDSVSDIVTVPRGQDELYDCILAAKFIPETYDTTW
jgi:hypothetical protein